MPNSAIGSKPRLPYIPKHLRHGLIPSAQNAGTRPPQLANPEVAALQLAHLKDATMKGVDRVPAEKGTLGDRYYQAVTGCVVGPTVLDAGGLNRFSFTLGPETRARLPAAKKLRPHDPEVREIKQGSLMYRVKTAKASGDTLTEEQFQLSDLYWPPFPTSLIIDVPGASKAVKRGLDQRKKHHFGRDLPMDLTQVVAEHPAHELPIEVLAILSKPDLGQKVPQPQFAFAVEQVQVLRHAAIVDMVKAAVIPASQTAEEIKRKLNPDLDDDDVCMVPTDLKIGLQDPWLAKLWTVPVKGVECRHGECFDLSTFLETRPRARIERSVLTHAVDSEDTWVSAVDAWRCPLCGGDVRPEKLRVCLWMVEVREKLLGDGRAEEASAIVVSPDGSWKVVDLEKGREKSAGGGMGKKQRTKSESKGPGVVNGMPEAMEGVKKATEKVVHVIELD